MNTHDDRSQVAGLDEARFQSEVLSAKQPVLVAFSAPWSRPCQIIGPVIQDLATSASGSLQVFKVNVDDHFDLGMWYDIQSIPTLLCFVNGKECVRIVGTASREAILAKLQPFIANRP
jgi:thioredoxin 1